MKFQKLFLYTSLAITLFACSENDGPDIRVDAVRSSRVEILADGGARFFGEIIQEKGLTEHGFMYTQDTNVWNLAQRKISLGTPEGKGEFSAAVLSGIQDQQKYYFRAYGESASGMFYGKIISFFSNGSVAPQISRVDPTKGHLNETIKIVGTNLGISRESTALYFDQQPIETFTAQDSVITTVIPPNLTSAKFVIRAVVYGKAVEYPYELATPEINKISPLTATFREEVIIEGAHFGDQPSENEVYFGEVPAQVIGAERNKLIVIVPDDLDIAKSKITVKAQRQTVISEEFFEIKAPIIESYDECMDTYQMIEIFGSNFHPISHKNMVLLEGVEAEVMDVYPDKLYAMVPQGPFPRGKMTVEVIVAGASTKGQTDVCIKDEWLLISTTLPFAYYGGPGTFVVNNKAYVFAVGKNDFQKLYMWEFNPTNLSWKKHELPFELSHFGNTASTGNKGYLYTANDRNEVWEFDGISWKERARFIGPYRVNSSMFAIGQKVYLGMGMRDNTSYQDFYSYESTSNQWKPIAQPLAAGRIKAVTFVIDGKAYITDGASNTGEVDMMRYDPADTWTRMADQAYARLYSVGFALNGKGYTAIGSSVVGSGSPESHVYDPQTNTWSHGPPVGHKGRYRGFAFVLNGEAYIGGGAAETNYINEGVEYDLLKWVKK
ncbi:IPT/TIG domain-containing protein [Mongoliitalea lutea]|uniref:IPT/TIG domain-containing protein n=1 Tax=Mongoliitalea lutea TaxID=849756 RepID=A0A8J3CX27_9BACT|nr:IPT/TIG domain-containing protein [Mongoliitalea lutea]GHB38571.1 hypothetical protein GCM10008106_19710 [Mongoliitalea lutea]